jgi:AGZA family xanthine/uracil permease-like MFS transporter
VVLLAVILHNASGMAAGYFLARLAGCDFKSSITIAIEVGMQNSGLVVADPATKVNLASFNLLGSATWGSVMPLLVTIAAVIAIAIMSKKGVKGAILWGILGAAVLYYALGFTVEGFYTNFWADKTLNPLVAFKDFGTGAVGKVFTEGFNFDFYLLTHNVGELIVAFATTALAFCMVDMFDTMGTLYGACRGGNLLIKNDKGEDEVPNMNRAMLADAVATCTGAVCGTSTVTTYVESSAGVGAGGRTGLTAVVTALCFIASAFLATFVSAVPSAATAPALVVVGIMMTASFKEIEWHDFEEAVPAFFAGIFMALCYSISYGIAAGFIFYVIVKLCRGKAKEINPLLWVCTALFLLNFVLLALI